MQRKIPYVTDAHVGFLALQSKHILFSDRDLSFLKMAFLSGTPSDAIGFQNLGLRGGGKGFESSSQRREILTGKRERGNERAKERGRDREKEGDRKL